MMHASFIADGKTVAETELASPPNKNEIICIRDSNNPFGNLFRVDVVLLSDGIECHIIPSSWNEWRKDTYA